MAMRRIGLPQTFECLTPAAGTSAPPSSSLVELSTVANSSTDG